MARDSRLHRPYRRRSVHHREVGPTSPRSPGCEAHPVVDADPGSVCGRAFRESRSRSIASRDAPSSYATAVRGHRAILGAVRQLVSSTETGGAEVVGTRRIELLTPTVSR